MTMRTSRVEMHDTLKRARDKIQQEHNWTQGALARKRDGEIVEPQHPEARQWCAMGALYACDPSMYAAWDIENLLRLIVQVDSGYNGSDADDAEFPSLTSFNYFNDDYATHQDIIGIFDKTLEILDSETEERIRYILENELDFLMEDWSEEDREKVYGWRNKLPN